MKSTQINHHSESALDHSSSASSLSGLPNEGDAGEEGLLTSFAAEGAETEMGRDEKEEAEEGEKDNDDENEEEGGEDEDEDDEDEAGLTVPHTSHFVLSTLVWT